MSRQGLCPGRRAGQGKDSEDRPGVVADLDVLKTIMSVDREGFGGPPGVVSDLDILKTHMGVDREGFGGSPGVVAEATPALPPRLAIYAGSGTAGTRYRYSMNATRIVVP